MEFSFYIQDPTYAETTYLYEAIIGATVNAATWRGVYAFASRDGVNHLIEDPIVKQFMRDGGKIDLLVGLDAVTNRSTLERLQELEQGNEFFRPRVFWNEDSALFHPKISYFSYAGGQQTLIVGSGNLTPGGLMTNFECYTVITADHSEEIDVSALDEFWERHTDKIKSIDDKALERAASNLIRSVSGAQRAHGTVTRKAHPQKVVESVAAFDRILIAQVPKAGGRWAQVHFNTDVVQKYFHISNYKTQRIYLTQIAKNGTRTRVEVRPCVYSQINKNHKIEIGAAKGKEYPNSPPVLVFRKRQLRVFDYLLLLPGDNGYGAVIDLTRRLEVTGRGFPRVITDMDILEKSWADCPLLTSEEAQEREI